MFCNFQFKRFDNLKNIFLNDENDEFTGAKYFFLYTNPTKFEIDKRKYTFEINFLVFFTQINKMKYERVDFKCVFFVFTLYKMTNKMKTVPNKDEKSLGSSLGFQVLISCKWKQIYQKKIQLPFNHFSYF